MNISVDFVLVLHGFNPSSHVEAEDAPATLRAKRVHLNDVEKFRAFSSWQRSAARSRGI